MTSREAAGQIVAEIDHSYAPLGPNGRKDIERLILKALKDERKRTSDRVATFCGQHYWPIAQVDIADIRNAGMSE